MSKKADPVLAVLRYFREAELPLALQALAMVQATVRERTGPKRRDTTEARSKKKPVVVNAPAEVTRPVGTGV